MVGTVAVVVAHERTLCERADAVMSDCLVGHRGCLLSGTRPITGANGSSQHSSLGLTCVTDAILFGRSPRYSGKPTQTGPGLGSPGDRRLPGAECHRIGPGRSGQVSSVNDDMVAVGIGWLRERRVGRSWTLAHWAELPNGTRARGSRSLLRAQLRLRSLLRLLRRRALGGQPCT